jgi:hypothetical protein
MIFHAATSFEEFKDYYEQTGLVQAGKSRAIKKIVNEKQLHTAFKSHLQKVIKATVKVETKHISISGDQILRVECMERDHNTCRLLSRLTILEEHDFNQNANFLKKKLDAAHVFGKNAYPHMRYMLDNIVILNRISHNWLDICKSPINGKPITKEERAQWWKRIIGASLYETLEKISREDHHEKRERLT